MRNKLLNALISATMLASANQALTI